MKSVLVIMFAALILLGISSFVFWGNVVFFLNRQSSGEDCLPASSLKSTAYFPSFWGIAFDFEGNAARAFPIGSCGAILANWMRSQIKKSELGEIKIITFERGLEHSEEFNYWLAENKFKVGLDFWYGYFYSSGYLVSTTHRIAWGTDKDGKIATFYAEPTHWYLHVNWY